MPKAFLSKPSLELNVTEAQFRAVGHVVLQWAYLEGEIVREIAWLLSRSEHKRRKVNLQTTDRTFAKKMARWRILSHRSYKTHPSLIKAVDRIQARAVAIKKERDDLAHGTMTANMFFKQKLGKIINISEVQSDPEYLEDLACRISKISEDLFKHQFALQKHFRKTGII